MNKGHLFARTKDLERWPLFWFILAFFVAFLIEYTRLYIYINLIRTFPESVSARISKIVLGNQNKRTIFTPKIFYRIFRELEKFFFPLTMVRIHICRKLYPFFILIHSCELNNRRKTKKNKILCITYAK